LQRIADNLSRWLVRLVLKTLMAPLLETLRAQHKQAKKDFKSSEAVSQHIVQLNAEYYPRYQKLADIAELVLTAQNITDEQWTETVQLKTFFQKPDFANRRTKKGSIKFILEFLAAVRHNHANPKNYEWTASIEAGAKTKWEPKHWQLPVPGAAQAAPAPDEVQESAVAVVTEMPDDQAALQEIVTKVQNQVLVQSSKLIETALYGPQPAAERYELLRSSFSDLPSSEYLMTIPEVPVGVKQKRQSWPQFAV